MGEIRRGFHGVHLGVIPLGIQGVEHHFARHRCPVLHGFHMINHRHGPGMEHAGFLPQSAGQGNFPLHHSLASALGRGLFQGDILFYQSHIHCVYSPFRLLECMWGIPIVFLMFPHQILIC